jgi:NADPH:quinone reductase-like Zn-dependent oxidoreductase
MKAIVTTKYGSSDVLQLREVEKPVPSDDQVLVQVHAASVNILDLARIGGTVPVRLFSGGFLGPKFKILGADIAGRVEATGRNAGQFRPGDEVFGDIGEGGFAEYVCTAENKLALKPANISFEAAAAVPVTAFTALQGLRDKGQIQPGQKVLINGASGGVGTFAVQIAKSFGAEVTAVCSTRNLDQARSIGADYVIDYTQEDFTQNGQRYDLIFDSAASRQVSDYQRALNPNGICVIAGFSKPTMSRMFQAMFVGPWVSRNRSQKIGFMGLAKPNQKDLVVIKELIEAGKVVPVIDRRYPLSDAPEALRYLEEGHARGKIVIAITKPGIDPASS